MIRTVAVALISLAALCGCSSESANTAEAQQAIRDCYAAYKQAILDQSGDRALELVSDNTLQYYGEMHQKALISEESEVRSLSTIDKMMVLSIRHRIPSDSVRAMTRETFFSHAVEQGWISRESVARNQLGTIAVTGLGATAAVVVDGRESLLKWSFLKENGAWKIDLTSIIPAAGAAMAASIRESGMTEEELMKSALETMTGRPVDESIWNPIGP